LGIDPDARQRGLQAGELGLVVGVRLKVLQCTTAALSEMPANRAGAPIAGDHQFDHSGVMSIAAAPPEHRANLIARCCERQVDPLAAPARHTVAVAADSRDANLDQFGSRFHAP
jgi:hypothetical protein